MPVPVKSIITVTLLHSRLVRLRIQPRAPQMPQKAGNDSGHWPRLKPWAATVLRVVKSISRTIMRI